MTNVQISYNADADGGPEYVITIKADQDHGPSQSGKTRIVGTTHGAVTGADGLQLSINAYRKG